MKPMRAQEQQGEKPTFGELIGRLATESGELVRAEIALAKRELSDKVEQSADSGKMFAIGAVLGLATLFSFSAFLIFVLAVFLPTWAAAGLVTLLFGAGAFVAIKTGLSKWRNINLKPEQTLETLEEDKRWIKQLDLD